MKRHFFKQSLLRTMMIVATLLFMMPAQNATKRIDFDIVFCY